MSGAGHMALPDEDTLTFPRAWRSKIIPRRGRPTSQDFTLRPAPEPSVPQNQAFAELLAQPDSDPELVSATRQVLADHRQATPPGVAVLLLGQLQLDGLTASQQQAELDYWLASRGAAFMVSTLLELLDLMITAKSYRRFTLHRRSRHSARSPFPVYATCEPMALRLRAYLAHSSDQEYTEACAAAAHYRDRDLDTRVMTSFLFPTRTDWVDADSAAVAISGDKTLASTLWCAVSSPEQLRQIHEHVLPSRLAHRLDKFVTGVDGVGPAIAPFLISWWERADCSAAFRQQLLTMLTHLPTDEAMRELVARLDQSSVRASFVEAQQRFPVRALRILVEAIADKTVAEQLAGPLLRAQVARHPELVATALPALPAAAAAYLAQVTAEARGGHHTDVPFAPADSLPSVLVDPPWRGKHSTEKAPVVSDLTPPSGTELVWEPGEQESWLTSRPTILEDVRENWEKYAAQYRTGTLSPYLEDDFFLEAPADIPREWVASWRPRYPYDPERWLPKFVARYEQDALPALWHVAKKQPVSAAPFLMPFANVEIALQMADWLSRTRTVRATALTWLRRHPTFAARALIPAALGKPGRRRRAAEQALRTLAETHRDEVLAAAREYGEAALAGVESLLTADPLASLPAQVPHLPSWVDPVLLPPVLVRDRTSVLPPEAVRHLCTMLALSTIDEQYAGVAPAKEACDPSSLAEFAWALFEQWRSAGMPSQERWAFTALAWLGDDQTVHRLDPLIRVWPGQGKHPHAVTGLDVLARIDTDAALRQLADIARKAKFKALREQAQQKLTEAAARRGLTAAQLEDRLVPDLGLDERGSLTLDYGPRRFTVGFDEQLTPYVLDQTGKPHKTLPKPGRRDDPQLAPTAYQRFRTLKKEVRALAASQITRLEQAMVNQRRWSFTQFRELLMNHPLMWHLVRRLVWGWFDGDTVAGFRVAEDRSLADVNDETLRLDDDAIVGVAHPLHLDETVPTWSEIFADYELRQPFPQLGRKTHTLTASEQQAETLDRFHGLTVPTGKLLGLERRGWRRAAPQDGGLQPWLLRPLPNGWAAVINLEPGIIIGQPHTFPEQQLTTVWLDEHGLGDWQRRNARRFGELDPVTASELLRELTDVAGEEP